MLRLFEHRFIAYIIGFLIVQIFLLPVRFAMAGELIDIYSKAQSSDYQVKVDEYAFKDSQESKAIGRAALLPSLSLVSGYSREKRALDYGVAGSPQRSTLVSNDTAVLIAQPILNFPIWYDYLRLNAIAERGKLDFVAAKQDLMVRVAQGYLSVLKSKSQSRLYKQEESAYQEFLSFVKSRLNAGVASVIDVHEAEAAYNSAKINTINALSVESNYLVELEVLLGQRYPVSFSVSDEYPYREQIFNVKGVRLDMVTKNNLSLGAQRLQSESLFYAKRSIGAMHYPKVELRLSYGVSSEVVSGGYQSSGFEKVGSFIAVNFTLPIFAGGGTSAAIRKANFEYHQSLEMEQLLWRKINASVESAFSSIESKRLILEVYAASIDSNESGLSATVAGYKLGVKNLSDVLISQRLLYQARREQRNALLGLIFDIILLRQACGILSESDLVAIDQWLVPNSA